MTETPPILMRIHSLEGGGLEDTEELSKQQQCIDDDGDDGDEIEGSSDDGCLEEAKVSFSASHSGSYEKEVSSGVGEWRIPR